MNTIRVEILNPKAKKLLKSLEELNLIAIQDSSEIRFSKLLQKFRSKETTKPTLDETTREIEWVRDQNNHNH